MYIGRLPVELLSYIFITVVEDEMEEYHEAVAEGYWLLVNAPLLLSWVCRYWRSVAHTTPSLWTFAQINITSNSPNRALHFVRLWGSLQGSITAENVSFYGTSNRYTTMFLIPRDQVKEYIYREKADDPSHMWASSVVFPTARKVVVQLREKGDIIRHGDWTRSFEGASSVPVVSVELYNCELSRLPESMEEFKWSLKTHIRPYQLSHIVSLPNLRRLHLCHMTFTLATMIPIPEIQTASKITHLILENMSSQLFRLLKSSSLPTLNRLGLFDFAFADDDLIHFIIDISPTLRTLDIVGPPPMLLEAWRSLLQAAYGVRDMMIGFRGPLESIPNANFIGALQDSTGVPQLGGIWLYDRFPYASSSMIIQSILPICMKRGIRLQ